MKTKNYSDYLIAFSVLGCSAVLLGALTMALSGFRWPQTGHTVLIDFPSVTGIHVNSQVRYAGKPVGVVREIEFLTFEERKKSPQNAIRVKALLYSDAPELLAGTTACINSDTLLSEKFVDLIPIEMPDKDEPLGGSFPTNLTENDIIQGEESVSFDALSKSGYQTLEELNRWIAQLRTDCPDLPKKVASLIANGEKLMQNADQLATRIDKLVEQNDPQLKHVMRDLQVISQNLKVTSTYAKTLSGTLAERPWRLVWGGKPNQLPSEEEILKSQKSIRRKTNEPPAPTTRSKSRTH